MFVGDSTVEVGGGFVGSGVEVGGSGVGKGIGVLVAGTSDGMGASVGNGADVSVGGIEVFVGTGGSVTGVDVFIGTAVCVGGTEVAARADVCVGGTEVAARVSDVVGEGAIDILGAGVSEGITIVGDGARISVGAGFGAMLDAVGNTGSRLMAEGVGMETAAVLVADGPTVDATGTATAGGTAVDGTPEGMLVGNTDVGTGVPSTGTFVVAITGLLAGDTELLRVGVTGGTGTCSDRSSDNPLGVADWVVNAVWLPTWFPCGTRAIGSAVAFSPATMGRGNGLPVKVGNRASSVSGCTVATDND